MKLLKKWIKYSVSVAYSVAYRKDIDRSNGNPGRIEFADIPDLPLEKNQYSKLYEVR
jgi:hypothetical protein